MKQSQKNLNVRYSKKTINALLKYYDEWDSYEQDLMSLGFLVRSLVQHYCLGMFPLMQRY